MTEHVRVPREAVEEAHRELDIFIRQHDALEPGGLAMTPLARVRRRIENEMDGDAAEQALDIVEAVGEATETVTDPHDQLTEAIFRARSQLDDALETGDSPETTLILWPVTGATRRLRLRPSETPGAAAALEESTWTGRAWHHSGREELECVEVDGVRYGPEAVEHCGGP